MIAVPADLVIDIRQQEIRLYSGGRVVTISNSGRFGPFANGPVPWSRLLMAYLEPALAQFAVDA